MRLLHSKTLQFKYFFDSDLPKYLILSHRWVEDETSLQEFEAKRHLPDTDCSAGIIKVKQFCNLATENGFDWVWVDTCCIDKTSSTELTEAINSMWKWYRKAACCYVYMNDVISDVCLDFRWDLNGEVHVDPQDSRPGIELRREAAAAFHTSAWFTRGWTLQELLAPEMLWFFNVSWKRIGTRDEWPLNSMITEITHVPHACFGHLRLIREATVAERMSWVSQRATSRVEDIAYCMMGIFDVQMPLLYGEGRNAFLRLQLEIIAKYDDETIFCWLQAASTGNPWPQAGMLAPSPVHFSWIWKEQAKLECREWLDRAPFQMTNKGLGMQLYGNPATDPSPSRTLPVPLNVVREQDGVLCWVSIVVCQYVVRGRQRHWYRVSLDKLEYRREHPRAPSRFDQDVFRYTLYIMQHGGADSQDD